VRIEKEEKKRGREGEREGGSERREVVEECKTMR